MIVCLGWGSLIWRVDDLPVEMLESDVAIPDWVLCPEGGVGNWRPDGPPVRVEFVRQSGCGVCPEDQRRSCDRGRLTLVLHKGADAVPSLWARMTVDTPDAAVKALAERENVGSKNIDKNIGRWPRNGNKDDPMDIPGLARWAASRDVEHVVWTALGPKFGGKNGEFPTEDDAVKYLDALDGEHRKAAEKYVRCAPPQIDTAYRRRISGRL